MAEAGRPRRPSLRRADFERVTRDGRRVVTPLFLVFILARTDGHGPRLGITVTRKVGNAVRRNRIKRLVREWFRQRCAELPCCDVVVIARRDMPAAVGLAEVAPSLDAAIAPPAPQGS